MSENKLTPDQEKVLLIRAARSRSWKKYTKQEHALLEKIAPTCTHPVTHDYTWEHDDGYGKQYMITGECCDFCPAQRAWKSQSYWRIPQEGDRKNDY